MRPSGQLAQVHFVSGQAEFSPYSHLLSFCAYSTPFCLGVPRLLARSGAPDARVIGLVREYRHRSETERIIDRLSRKKFEEQLAALEDLRENAGAPATVDSLRKALANRNNYIAAKAS